MSIKITEKQTNAAKGAFEKYDKKGENTIKVGDIGDAMKSIGHSLTAEWLEKYEELIDTEGTGHIEFDEFLEVLRKKLDDDENERELKDCFRVLDKEKRGEVNVMEIRWILKNLGCELTEEDIDEMIADVDTDGSGFVDYDEFAKLMNE